MVAVPQPRKQGAGAFRLLTGWHQKSATRRHLSSGVRPRSGALPDGGWSGHRRWRPRCGIARRVSAAKARKGSGEGREGQNRPCPAKTGQAVHRWLRRRRLGPRRLRESRMAISGMPALWRKDVLEMMPLVAICPKRFGWHRPAWYGPHTCRPKPAISWHRSRNVPRGIWQKNHP